MEILQIIATGSMLGVLGAFIIEQHHKTRKETQEIKTRLTQVRKDLNTIEKLLRKGVK